MNSEQLRQIQAPLKADYTAHPEKAVVELNAAGQIDIPAVTCTVTVSADGGKTVSGLHPVAGGDGSSACSGDMLLQSLAACSGVTFAAVATAMDLQISAARVDVLGRMDFRGTLGIDRETAVGLTSVELTFFVDSDEPPEKIDKLIQLTGRYCVVLQTLQQGVPVSSRRG